LVSQQHNNGKHDKFIPCLEPEATLVIAPFIGEAEPSAETKVDSLDSVDPDLDAVDAVDYAPLNGSNLDLV
jgi:hypothetical protein